MKKRKIHFNWEKIVFWFVFISLIGSAIFAAICIGTAPAHLEEGQPYQKLKSDYILMVLQCILGAVVMFLPTLIERRFKIEIPGFMYIVFIIFLYGAIYLGEVRSFYYKIPNWDTILHTFSGAMLGALGFVVVDILNKSKRVKLMLSPLFVSIFALCFAVTLGVLWEFYEYTFDGILGLNMQKFALENGTPLVGREALQDTMEDLLVDAAGALVIAAIGFINLKKKKAMGVFPDILEHDNCDKKDNDALEKQ